MRLLRGPEADTRRVVMLRGAALASFGVLGINSGICKSPTGQATGSAPSTIVCAR